MTLRLVVCVLWRPPLVDAETDTVRESWGTVARSLAERATALGGRIVGWQQGSLSVDFAVDGLQDAVDFLVDEPLGSSLAGGFALGDLEECLEGHRIALCSGEVLDVVQGLAGAARPGEVLVAPELVEAARGELLTSGPAKKRPGREHVVAFVLDVVHPLRSLLAEAVAGLVEPRWLGDAALLGRLAAPPGKVAVLCAEDGAGGTRCLEELARGHAEVLWVRPGRRGWPGGAVSLAVGSRPGASLPELEERLRATRAALVLVDDAERVDGDSLELLAEWCGSGGTSLVLRVRPPERAADGSLGFPDHPALERILASAPVSAVEALPPLSGDLAAELARAATSGRLAPKELEVIAALGEQRPLAVLERLSRALESGDWVVVGESIRSRSEGPLEAVTLDACVAGRLARLPAEQRLVLETCVVLGQADPEDVARVLEMLKTSPLTEADVLVGQVNSRTPQEVGRELSDLVAGRWMRAAPLRVASATVLRVVESETPEARLRALHALAARLGLRSGSWAGRVAAVVHAARTGRTAQARDLARSAEPVAVAAGAHATATALHLLAEDGDVTALGARGLLGPPHVERAEVELLGEGGFELGVAVSPTPPPAAPVAPIEANESFVAAPVTSESDSLFPQQLGDALARRDPSSLLQLAHAARARHQEPFAERVEALACLVNGQPGEALARLRRARERALEASLSEQCRAELALAVGLAASGLAQEAFLGALAALARAREGGDRRGERACARFLGELAQGLGDVTAAARWRELTT